MSDILSQGGDREPGPWRRGAVVIAVLALAAVLVVLQLPRHPHHVPRPRAQSAGPGPPVRLPAGYVIDRATVRCLLLAPVT